MNIGLLYFDKNDFSNALKNFKDSLKFADKFDVMHPKPYCYKYIGEIHFLKGNYSISEQNIIRSLKIAKKMNENPLIKDNYKLLSDLYSKKSKYKKSLEYFKLYSDLKDKIYSEFSAKSMAEMETKYEMEKKENIIKLLEKDKELQNIKLKNQKNLRNTFLIIIGLLLVIFIQFFRKFRYFFAFWKKKNYIGSYKIIDKIATGGMGTVYKAHDVRDKSRTLAIKVLKEEYFSNETYKKRFKNEANIIDRLNHPNIVKIMERGENNGNIYIAMELLVGKSLSEILESGEKLNTSIILKIMVQIVDALIKIHNKNIIHRDLKPENIMIVKTKQEPYLVKILDFGLAKTQSLTRLTQTGIIMGTIFYLAPEQISNKQVSTASDIYSLGVIYYQLLCGERPFFGDTGVDIAKQILEKDPIEPDKFQPDIPEELNNLVMNMVNKDPKKRPIAEEVFNILKNINGF
jgi:tRNA A-37 threonylcarbamoyl transferase component Bud32